MAAQAFVPHVFFGLDPMVVSTTILCVTFAVIIWDKLNRAIVALVGAAAAILIGVLDQNEALKGVDWNTIGVLMTPLTLAIMRDLKVPPSPFLFAEVFSANIGGSTTLIGDPPNIMI